LTGGDDLKETTNKLLGMRVYDILNILGNLMMKNNSNEEELCIKCINGLTGKDNLLTIHLKEIQQEGS
jgi:hypothetical protein